MLMWLRVCVGVIATVSLITAVQCFLDDQYPLRRIYTLVQPNEATPLLSRLFGLWVLLATVVRFSFVACPRNKSLFLATLLSFVVAFVHFITEVFVYGTAELSYGTVIPITISGLAMLWMSLEWPVAQSTENKTL